MSGKKIGQIDLYEVDQNTGSSGCLVHFGVDAALHPVDASPSWRATPSPEADAFQS